MAFKIGADRSISSINKIIQRTLQTEQQVIGLQKEIEYLEAADIKTFVKSKILEIRNEIQQLDHKTKLLTKSNGNLKKEIFELNQCLSINETKDDNKNNEEQTADDHGYSDAKLTGKCGCEMCVEGIATTHNDSSHDQSLFAKFTLDVDHAFELNLVGGSTKCGRVMANYFAYLQITKKTNVFKDKKCLEVGSGTGIVGCTVAYLGANKVILTDQPGVVDILAENAKQLNKYQTCNIEIGELLWGETDANKYINYELDILIGSDLIYAHEFIKPLVNTFEILSNQKNKKTDKYPIVFMSVIRRFKWEENFFNLMKNKFVQYKELEVGDICIYKYVRKEDEQQQ